VIWRDGNVEVADFEAQDQGAAGRSSSPVLTSVGF
jgi:hypothetical protein